MPHKNAFRRAKLVLLFERLWPCLFFLFLSFGLAFSVSLFGFRLIGLIVLGLGSLYALYQLKDFRFPTSAELLARLNEGQAHRPLTQLNDVNMASTPLAKELWEKAQAALVIKLPPLFPRFNTPVLDPFAMRAVVALGLLAALVFNPAWQEAFRFAPAPTKGWRVDMWVTPPAYTNLSPVMLFAAKDESEMKRASQMAFPQGSKLSLRATGFNLQLLENNKPQETRDFTLAQDMVLTLKNVPRLSAQIFSLHALPDLPPQVRFTSPQFKDEKNHLKLEYVAEDDYGVVSGEAEVKLSQPHDFVKLPNIELALPQGGKGEARSSQDLSTHPFAGLEASLQLKVKDEKGQEGLSAKHIITLPIRNFTKPLASALIEQRQRLALSLKNKGEVVEALDLLMLAPEQFTLPLTHYLALRTASTRLKRARSEAAHLSVLDYLYEIALAIEEGNLSEAEKELKAAQEALENALKNNADEKTLQQLTQNLKDAMQKMLQELAKDLENEPFSEGDDQQAADLNEQLKELDNLNKEGAREQAQKLLDQLKQQMQEMMQAKREGRLRRANPQQKGQQNQLSEMIRRQQQLRDNTFQDKGEADAQRQLREDLDAMKNDKLGEAGEAMREAERQMRQGNKQGAMEAQRRALQGLQQESQAQAQAQAERERQQGQGQQGQQGQPGEGQREGRNSNDPRSTDPLGRQQQGRDDPTNTKAQDLLSKPEQAKKILEELRKRAGETLRPQEERDYLDRLLKGLK